jgi:hypothetical protein
MSNTNRRGNRIQIAGLNLALAAAATTTAATAAGAQHVFWQDHGTLTLPPGFAPSAFLTDDNVAAVDQFLATQTVRAVKIDRAVSPATLAAIYDKYKVDYTFLDHEGPDAVARTTAMVGQIRQSAATGPAVATNKAFVGNFALTPTFADPTAPGGAPQLGYAQYASAGANAAAPVLYPGSPGFRNPAAGNSAAPNVRSALFALPIERLSITTASLPAGHANVPYVDRFNNWQNATLDTDQNPANGYRFVTQDQLPSRGDFRAQVLHYRLRGATAVHGLEGGVEGYTAQQFTADIHQGWTGVAAVNDVLADPRARLATLDTSVNADGVARTIEEAGVVWSGAYSAAKGKLVVLLSNLDATPHAVTLPTKVGGKTVSGEFTVAAGSHEILEFGATGTSWNLVSEQGVFVDHDRAGAGVPEPTGLAAVALAALALRRRSRRAR